MDGTNKMEQDLKQDITNNLNKKSDNNHNYNDTKMVDNDNVSDNQDLAEYLCPHCNKPYQSQPGLKAHIKYKHKDITKKKTSKPHSINKSQSTVSIDDSNEDSDESESGNRNKNKSKREKKAETKTVKSKTKKNKKENKAETEKERT